VGKGEAGVAIVKGTFASKAVPDLVLEWVVNDTGGEVSHSKKMSEIPTAVRYGGPDGGDLAICRERRVYSACNSHVHLMTGRGREHLQVIPMLTQVIGSPCT
jgi:hypothetical protein